jgi:hypothetical protein
MNTIRPTVSPEAIEKVTRIFNGSLSDVLNELLQNARRAGATRIDIDLNTADTAPLLTITDDGTGISDPATLLSLGQSDWSSPTTQSEDPAGMGFFALAGRATTVETAGAGFAYRFHVPADAWTGNHDIAVEPCQRETGTTISFEPHTSDPRVVGNFVSAAAIHFPIPVYFNATLQKQADFLSGAHQIICANGLRIGVYKNVNIDRTPNINFHGVTLNHSLPTIKEWRSTKWSVRVDIIDCPELVLVLPARKEVYRNDGLARLICDCETAIATAIAAEPYHQLEFQDWQKALDYVPSLPPARPCLSPWQANPARSDYQEHSAPAALQPQPIIYDEEDAYDAQSFQRALTTNTELALNAYVPVPAYEGYPWYDAIPKYRREEIHYRDADGTDLEPEKPTSRPAEITVTIRSETGDPITYQTDVLLGDSEHFTNDPDDIFVAVTRTSTITSDELAHMIFEAGFTPYEDHDADSYDTQENRYQHDATVRATQILAGDDAAAIADIAMTFQDRIAWRVPADKDVTIIYRNNTLSVTFSDKQEGQQP